VERQVLSSEGVLLSPVEALRLTRAYMRLVHEAAMARHDEAVRRLTRVRDPSPAEAYFLAVGLPGAPAPPAAPAPRPALSIPAPAKHSWNGLCHKELLARGHRPVFYLAFPPRGQMDVFDDPDGLGYLGVSNCAHYPFDKAAFEREHRVTKIEEPRGTPFHRILTYRHHVRNEWATLSYYRTAGAPAAAPHPWDGLCHPAILAGGYRPIFQFSVDTFVPPVDVFADPVANTYVMVPGCSRRPFDMTASHREFEEKDTAYHSGGSFYKTVNYKHRTQSTWATMKYYQR
jgi:hypothetical protein